MLLKADAQFLHDLKHEFEREIEEDLKISPAFSKEKVRHRRLKNLENRYHDDRYLKLKNLFQEIKAKY